MRGRRLAALALIAVVALGASGCAAASEASDLPANAVVLDVRTPAEYASGHLEGAHNLDVFAADFDAKAAELDPAQPYLVYCRSGNRSAQAAARLGGLGFDDVVDLGGLDAAAATTGLAIVTP